MIINKRVEIILKQSIKFIIKKNKNLKQIIKSIEKNLKIYFLNILLNYLFFINHFLTD